MTDYKKMRISIQGYEGSFHQMVAERYFGEDIELIMCPTFREVTGSVEKGIADAGVMAIENSIAGSILPNYSLLQNSSLSITGEVYLSIKQNLMAVKGAKLSDIKEIESHPMAILQCLDYIETEMQKVRIVESEDTGLSAKHVAEKGDKSVAAIASALAAEMFGLEILAPDINTVKSNYTRFLIIEKSDKVIPEPEADKASLYFKVPHSKGALVDALHAFDAHNMNMSKLQSYPIPTDPFRYLFHVDVVFDNIGTFKGCVQELKKHTEDFCICGIYKQGELIYK